MAKLHYPALSPRPIGALLAASFQVWDIDGTPALGREAWLAEALDGAGNVLESETRIAELGTNPPNDPLNPPGSQPPYPGDGVPYTFSFGYRPQADIKSLRISYLDKIPGSNEPTKQNVGLAFDNFKTDSPKSVPESSSAIALLALGAFGATSLLKRKKSAIS